MRVAIVGAGVAGLAAAWRLHQHVEVTLYEREQRAGGHAHTQHVDVGHRRLAVDTGFMVYNDRNYPGLRALFAALGVATKPTEMSFSVTNAVTGVEWAGTSLNTLFAQRGNLLSRRFHGMWRDVLRFNRNSRQLLAQPPPGPSLGEYVEAERLGTAFVDDYLLPMGAAIWSAPLNAVRAFPARAFVAFFHNHGLLDLFDRPRWRVVVGGSRTYVDALLAQWRGRVRLDAPVVRIHRGALGVEVETAVDTQRFDAVVIACHADTALSLLAVPSADERDVLGSVAFQRNELVLHRDERLLPSCVRAWASWNCHVGCARDGAVAVTYDLSRLQGHAVQPRILATLNRAADIDPQKIVSITDYEHPCYTAATFAAQARHADVSGVDRTFYCGAWWGYGFHEDGLVSGYRAADALLAQRATWGADA